MALELRLFYETVVRAVQARAILQQKHGRDANRSQTQEHIKLKQNKKHTLNPTRT